MTSKYIHPITGPTSSEWCWCLHCECVYPTAEIAANDWDCPGKDCDGSALDIWPCSGEDGAEHVDQALVLHRGQYLPLYPSEASEGVG